IESLLLRFEGVLQFQQFILGLGELRLYVQQVRTKSHSLELILSGVPVEFSQELYRGLQILFSAFRLHDPIVKMAHIVHGRLARSPDLLFTDLLPESSRLGLQSDLPLL